MQWLAWRGDRGGEMDRPAAPGRESYYTGQQREHEASRLRHLGRTRKINNRCGRGPGSRRLSEVLAPIVVLRERVRRAQAFPPHEVVGRIDLAILVEVARQDNYVWIDRLQQDRKITVDNVPGKLRWERRQRDVIERAEDAGLRAQHLECRIERGKEAVDERHVKHAVEVGGAGDGQRVVFGAFFVSIQLDELLPQLTAILNIVYVV
jgi:hypothetical protein